MSFPEGDAEIQRAGERRRLEDQIDAYGEQLAKLDPQSDEAKRIRSEQATLGERLHHLTQPD